MLELRLQPLELLTLASELLVARGEIDATTLVLRTLRDDHRLLRARLEIGVQSRRTEHDGEVLHVRGNRRVVAAQPLEQRDPLFDLAMAMGFAEHEHHQLRGRIVIDDGRRDVQRRGVVDPQDIERALGIVGVQPQRELRIADRIDRRVHGADEQITLRSRDVDRLGLRPADRSAIGVLRWRARVASGHAASITHL